MASASFKKFVASALPLVALFGCPTESSNSSGNATGSPHCPLTYNGTYDFSFRSPGPNGQESHNLVKFLLIADGKISSSDGTVSGSVDHGGAVTFTSPCPINNSTATWTGTINQSAQAGANFGQGKYTCALAIGGGNLNTWQATQNGSSGCNSSGAGGHAGSTNVSPGGTGGAGGPSGSGGSNSAGDTNNGGDTSGGGDMNGSPNPDAGAIGGMAGQNGAGGSGCVNPPSGLVSWLPGDGNANDVVGTYDGVIHGGVTFTPGKVEQGFNFDGVDSYIETPYSLAASTPQTVMFWMNSALVGSLQLLRISDQISLYTSIDTLCFGSTQTAIDMAHQGIYACSTAPANTWMHVAGSWDGTTARMYFDGALQDESTAGSGNDIAVTNTAIGQMANAYSYFKGTMDEIAIFDRALSEPEILAIYEAGISGMCGR